MINIYRCDMCAEPCFLTVSEGDIVPKDCPYGSYNFNNYNAMWVVLTVR
jgi:hypothetical protein